MAIAIFDRLNASFSGTEQAAPKLRSMPYEQYFGEMELDDDEKGLRVKAARRLELALLFIFAYIRSLGEYAPQYRGYIVESFRKEFRDAVEQYAEIDDYLENYINGITETITDTTLRHLDEGLTEDNYYLSDDRAMFAAEEEANTVHNYRMDMDARKDGMTRKKWRTMRDNRVRESHRELEGEVIGIDGVFQVGDVQMRFPRDYEYAGDYPQEIVNCRCSVEYLGDAGKTAEEGIKANGNSANSGNLIDSGGKSGILKSRDEKIEKGKNIGKAPSSMNQDDKPSMIPDSVKGDFSDFEPLSLSENERNALLELNKLSVESGCEYAVFVNGDRAGNPFSSNLADMVQVDITNILPGTSIFHSHTNDTPFSTQDFTHLLNENVEKIGVIAYNKDTYMASVGYGWRPSRDEFDQIVDNIEISVDIDLLNEPDFWNWTEEERNYMRIREKAYRIAREFGWRLEGGSLDG